MKIHVEPDPQRLAIGAAAFIARQARRAIHARQQFTLALSGGTAPRRMFEALSREKVQWTAVHVFQVDERVAAAHSGARNFSAMRTALLDHVAIPDGQVHPMPVDLDDLGAAADRYSASLRRCLGPAMALDLVHLGLGEDGHTASLLPGDPALESAADVVVSREYQGYRRLSLTFPVLAAARRRLWFVTGASKSRVLRAAVEGDVSIPAGRVPRSRTTFFVDAAAAAELRP
jgi:6-phosphogluconolactonase